MPSRRIDSIYPNVFGLVSRKSSLAFVTLFFCFFIKVKFLASGFLSRQMSFKSYSIIFFFTKCLLYVLFSCKYPSVSISCDNEIFQSPEY